MNSFLCLVPRGLQRTVKEILFETIHNDTTPDVSVRTVGEFAVDAKELGEALDLQLEGGRRANKKRKRHDKVAPTSSTNTVGTLSLNDVSSLDSSTNLPRNCYCSVGYRSNPNRKGEASLEWTTVGNVNGTVWMKIDTNAPLYQILHMRCLGPLVATVFTWEAIDSSEVPFGPSASLKDVREALERLLPSAPDYATAFAAALTLWRNSVLCLWNLDEEHQKALLERYENNTLHYRVSTLRNEQSEYLCTRQELNAAASTLLVPAQQRHGTVNLTTYDLEIVLMLRPHAFAIGVALRPYVPCRTKSFACGGPPPDVHPPLLLESSSTPQKMVRLRPSTASALLHEAQIQPGDLVLDPCCGLGTLPMEVLWRKSDAIALGGDLVLTTTSLGGVAARYAQQARHLQAQLHQRAVESSNPWRRHSVQESLAWDACHLPLRSACVDVIVSDLPFGQSCLSSSKLGTLLPLMMVEFARVVRPGSGRMVLLCGSYLPVLEAMQGYRAVTRTVDDALKGPAAAPAWVLPCASIFPITVGGLLAWVIHVQRSDAVAVPLPNQRERVRKLTAARDRIDRLQKNGKAGKNRNPQR